MLFVAKGVIQVAQTRDSGLPFAVLAVLALVDWRLTAIGLGLLVHREGGASERLFSECLAGLVILTAIVQIGVPPDFVREQLFVALICLVLAFIGDDMVLAALSLLVASISFPILFVAAGVCLLLAVLWKDRASLPIAAIAISAGVVEYYFEGAAPKAMAPAGFMALAMIWFSTVSLPRLQIGRVKVGVLLCVLSFLGCGVQRAIHARYGDPATRLKLQSWNDAGDWARMHTPNDAEFLIPPRMDGFQLHSLRRVWVDWQQGAAVMWSPAFYARWSGRFSDTLKLKSHREFNNYARAHDLPYYVMARNGPAGG